MSTEIAKIDPKEFGLEKQSVATIEQAFEPKIAERNLLTKVYENLISREITEGLCRDAKELRRDLAKTRIGIADVHKAQKAFFLAAGRFVDAWKNKETLPITQMEERLTEIENYYENLEKQRIATLAAERLALIQPLTEVIPVGLGEMQTEVFDNYLNGLKVAHAAKIEAERKAEEERQRIAKENQLHTERKEQILPLWKHLPHDQLNIHWGQLSENEWDALVSELKAKEQADIAERQRIEAENKRLEAQRVEAERLAKVEREKAEAERKRLEAVNAAMLEAERKKQAELAAQLAAKEKAERLAKEEAQRVEAQRVEAERKASLAPDKDKILAWIACMDVPVCKVKSPQAAATVEVISQKFAAFKAWAIAQTTSL